ncbi:MAG: protease complex subunit PrcB family protein [Chloroflexi bacterium]|nr:protease complex subunit PrcB family protein [Chloroflexota bacterium]
MWHANSIWHYLLVPLLVVGLVAAYGCAAGAKAVRFSPVADTVPWVLGEQPAYLVVTEANWSQYYKSLPAGADLKSNIYLVAYWGMRPNPGHQIKIGGVEQAGDRVTVKVEFKEPEPGKFYPQVIVYPISVAQVASKAVGKVTTFVFVDQGGKQLAEVRP